MTPEPHQPPSAEDLLELYRRLKNRVEKLEGAVQQIKSEGTHDALTRPTWRDLDALKNDIARLEKMICSGHRPRRLPDDKEEV